MLTTSNLGLRKPEASDVVDINDFNENADKLDGAIGNMSTVPTTAKNAAGAIAELHNEIENIDPVPADGSITDAKIGTRTIVDTVIAAPGSDTPTRLWSKLANMIKGITGAANWYTLPSMTLSGIITALGLKAPTASPVLTGTPTAPTAIAAANNTQIATTAFVKTALSSIGSTTLLTNGANLNSVITPGQYRGMSLVNRPAAAGDWVYVDVFAHDPSYCAQVCYNYYDNRVWTRRLNGGTWMPWIALHTSYVALGDATTFASSLAEISGSSPREILRYVPNMAGRYRCRGELRSQNSDEARVTMVNAVQFETTSTTYVAFVLDQTLAVTAAWTPIQVNISKSGTGSAYCRNAVLTGNETLDTPIP